MDTFYINGYPWQLKFVTSSSPMLVDRTGKATLATTDPRTNTVYICSDIPPNILSTVLVHELGHCIMVSYGLFDDIDKFVKPEYQEYAEEWICNFIADYGYEAFTVARPIIFRELEYI